MTAYDHRYRKNKIILQVSLYPQCSSTFTAGLLTATKMAGLCSHKNSHSGTKKARTINSIAQNYEALNLQDGQKKKKKVKRVTTKW